MKKLGIWLLVIASLFACKEQGNFIQEPEEPEEYGGITSVSSAQLELSETLSNEEREILNKFTELYQVPITDSVERIVILNEQGEEEELIAEISYPDTVYDNNGARYRFIRLEFKELLSGEGSLVYAYGNDLGEEVKGSAIILNDDFYHTKIKCDFSGCVSTLEKNGDLIGQEIITTSSSMTMDNDQL